jgi:ubiquinone/menaquinone biosynthesis C-methylase UbiE
MLDVCLIADLTARVVDAGHRIFQIHRFAPTEAAHCLRLLHWADLPTDAQVIDLGSGVGAMAAYWQTARPDLSFCLVNISAAQLAYSAFPSYCGDFCQLPYAESAFDAATFCFAIGHADRASALASASRVLRPGGILFLYDMVRLFGDAASMETVSYVVPAREEMEQALARAGFAVDYYMEPHDDGAYGRMVLGDDYDAVFHGTIPAIWRALKR